MRALLGLMLLILVAIGPAAAVEHKRVMILHSIGREFRPWNEYAQYMRAELDRQSPWPLDVQEHSLVTARTADRNPEGPFVEYLRRLYGDQPPDLIVVVGAPAASFIQRHRTDLFATAPMVFTTVEQRRVRTADLTEYDTIVGIIHDFRFYFESFLRIAPDTRTIAIINGDSPNEQFWQGEMRRELKPLEGRIEIRWYDKLSYEDLLKQTANLPPHSAIFWYQMIIDGAGVAHEGDRALTRLYQTANAPIFSHDEAFYGGDTGETVGGPMHSPLGGARRAAAVAIRILGGEKPGDIKTPSTRAGPPRYDWRELQRWKISERLLPPRSEIDFREPTTFEQYRWQVILVCSIVLAQAGLIALLLHERRRRQFAEVQSQQRMSELAHTNRYSMAGELTASIAHEINQPLGSILTNAETAQVLLKSPTPDLHELGEIIADIRRDDQRASDVILRLRSLLKKTPFELRDADLNALVAESLELLSGVAVARGVRIDRFMTAVPLPVSADRIQLQQVIINLMINAMDAMADMPAQDREMSVYTARIDGFAQVTVSDSGPGIPQEQRKRIFEPFFTTKPQGMGLGLSIARTIVEAHHGQLAAENHAGGGAVFHLRLPIAAATE
jgi:signal transduction histidine kinase